MRILLGGANGHLGKHLLRELKQKGFYVRVLVREHAKAATLYPTPDEVVVADASKPETLENCCVDIDLVISTIGKSISISDKSKGSFYDIDYRANRNLLKEAQKAGVHQFMYVSAFTAEQHPTLAYFGAHEKFAQELRQSGISYTILQPTALFSAFDEVVTMAKKGRLGSLGKGDKRTNPIYEGDLANIMVAAIGQPSQTIPVGGKKIYTRLELMQIAAKAAGYKKRIPAVPFAAVDILLPIVKLFSRNIYDKVAFLTAVSREDCIAPQLGSLTLEVYLFQEKQVV